MASPETTSVNARSGRQLSLEPKWFLLERSRRSFHNRMAHIRFVSMVTIGLIQRPSSWRPELIGADSRRTASIASSDVESYMGLHVRRRPLLTGKRVFIIGGSNSAGQAALFFANYASSVTMLVRGDDLKRSMSQYLIDQLVLVAGIRVETETQVVAADGTECLKAIDTRKRDESVIRRTADAVFVMIGADAVTHWLPPQLQRENGYVCTGREVSDRPGWAGDRAPFLLETNLPGFFCVGDVRYNSIKRVSSGVGEGSMAIAFVHQYLSCCSSR